ncbi:21370_t:CDS:1, partial [Racocetra persica]
MVKIVTRGESRKIKDRERKTAKRKDHLFQKSEINKNRIRIANLRKNEEYVQTSNIMRKNHQKQKRIEFCIPSYHSDYLDIPS